MAKTSVNLGGSINRKIVNPDLQEERDKGLFNAEEMSDFFWGKERNAMQNSFLDDIVAHPEWKTDFDYYDMTREEQMEMWFVRMNRIATEHRDKYFDKNDEYTWWQYSHIGTSPLSV